MTRDARLGLIGLALLVAVIVIALVAGQYELLLPPGQT